MRKKEGVERLGRLKPEERVNLAVVLRRLAFLVQTKVYLFSRNGGFKRK